MTPTIDIRTQGGSAAVAAIDGATADEVFDLELRPPPRLAGAGVATPRVEPAPVDLHAVLKRAVDVVVSAALLFAALPLIALVALLIVLDSRGPVFYRAPRVGRGGRELRMLKFRKMHPHASGAPLTTAEDARFTRVGALLAQTKIDELPQLWHVLRGEMSLIGPRPEDPGFVAERAREYEHILRVRPGVTGLSQIAFAEESAILDPEDPLGHYRARIFPQKIRLDRLYAARPTLRMDGAILFWTLAAVVLRRQVAVHRETGRMNLRRR